LGLGWRRLSYYHATVANPASGFDDDEKFVKNFLGNVGTLLVIPLLTDVAFHAALGICCWQSAPTTGAIG
jgi:hypothetical protein